jgi:DNA invertase Pin-like site-specific DNA recombinase
MERPALITADHLSRLAGVYGRQSSAVQVEVNTGSTEYQRAQADWARKWGWRPERIRRFEDFGLSGTATLHRPGYQELRSGIRAREIGAVFVSDITRLGRDAKELLEFIQDCNAYNVLIAIDGKVGDLKDTTEWFTAGFFALIAQYDGLTRRDTLQRGRVARLRSGRAVSAPPAGYISQPDKSWVKDPNPAVRTAVATVFREFLKHRTNRSTMLALHGLNQEMPRQKPGRPIHWRRATLSSVAEMIRHPAYKGDYEYRRRVDDHTKERSAKGRHRVRRAEAGETVVIKDHHESYISREEWGEIQAILRANNWGRDHANLGPGHAVAQGLMRCGKHGERLMATHYKRGPSGEGPHDYRCLGDYAIGGPGCGAVRGRVVDDMIVRALVARLSPPSIQSVRDALEAAFADQKAEQRRREVELARLRQQADDLTHKLTMLESGRHRVFKALAQRLEETTRQIEQIEQLECQHDSGELRKDAGMLRELESLAVDIWAIWSASTTTTHDRKELLRMLVRRVVVEEKSKRHIRIRIEWTDGWPSVRKTICLPVSARSVIAQRTAEGRSPAQIVEELQAQNARTLKGNVWSEKRVRHVLWEMSRSAGRSTSKRRRPRRDRAARIQSKHWTRQSAERAPNSSEPKRTNA